MLCKYVLHGKNTSVNNIFVYYLYNYVKLSNDASAFNLDSCKECFVNALLVHCCEYVIDQNFLGTHSSVFVFAMKDTKTWFCNLVPIDPTSVYESISKNVGICMHKLYHFHSLKLLPSWHGGPFFCLLKMRARSTYVSNWKLPVTPKNKHRWRARSISFFYRILQCQNLPWQEALKGNENSSRTTPNRISS